MKKHRPILFSYFLSSCWTTAFDIFVRRSYDRQKFPKVHLILTIKSGWFQTSLHWWMPISQKLQQLAWIDSITGSINRKAKEGTEIKKWTVVSCFKLHLHEKIVPELTAIAKNLSLSKLVLKKELNKTGLPGYITEVVVEMSSDIRYASCKGTRTSAAPQT